MTELLLETATEVCSVAVARNSKVLSEFTALEPYLHAARLTVFIQQVLQESNVTFSQIDQVILSDGPGSFTSLRVGAATVKGICTSMPELTLRVVPTPLAFASQVSNLSEDDCILVVLNSRKGEVYGQLFSSDLQELTPIHNVLLTEASGLKIIEDAAMGHTVRVCGPGQNRFREHLVTLHNYSFCDPVHAEARFLMTPEILSKSFSSWGRVVSVADYEPFYLNPPFVTKSNKKPLL